VNDERCDERKNKIKSWKGKKSEQSSGKDTNGMKGEQKIQCFGQVILDWKGKISE
jgi:hypothetical protein